MILKLITALECQALLYWRCTNKLARCVILNLRDYSLNVHKSISSNLFMIVNVMLLEAKGIIA